MKQNRYRPWLRAFSGLSINLSAAWLAAPVIGPNVSLPKSIWDFLILTLNIILAIVFLLLSVWCERKLKND